ncbi:MAG: class I SAM-dependent methyltransferase [bacterium]|nr:class I SAM-dependent methyltransferase [bacterium]
MIKNKQNENLFFKAPRYLFRKYNILRIINRLPVKSFVDIGCGAGELACTLAEKGYKGMGIDFSGDAIAVAENIRKQRGISRAILKFKKGSLSELPIKFDLLISCEVLEHLENDRKFLKDIHKYSDYFIFSVPARMKWFDVFDEKVGHFRRYEKKSMIQLLEDEGYEVIEFLSYGYPFINVTRLARKALASKVHKQKSTEEMTKQSGINPIKTKFNLGKLNIEIIIKPLYYLSLPFNKYNFSEGYLVLCEKKK